MAAKGHKLTPKQETFARKYVEGGSPMHAYREAFGGKGNDRTCATQAQRLLALPVVSDYIAELRADVRKDHGVTVAGLLLELEEARQVGKAEGQASAMVAATMAKAKLAGLDKGDGDESDVPTPVEIRVSVVDARKPNA
ncbi:terminase small subunit [Lysobacter enzymogenes]|uniref:terminase small subunit n=1 Tax=Lysobacter enzymogenes TaxID=69 RepID=UPI001A957933|nr:terminase small subunit [Lysobacter enzymogenes]QQP96537.1 terminase small subunit [Lysobacter enzymogenes]